eukprot:EG_transcript_14590
MPCIEDKKGRPMGLHRRTVQQGCVGLLLCPHAYQLGIQTSLPESATVLQTFTSTITPPLKDPPFVLARTLAGNLGVTQGYDFGLGLGLTYTSVIGVQVTPKVRPKL